jgi:hypothetical protein
MRYNKNIKIEGLEFTSLKECEIRKSLNNLSSDSNNTIWLGIDQFFANSDAKRIGSIIKRSDSSGIPFSSLLKKKIKEQESYTTFD